MTGTAFNSDGKHVVGVVFAVFIAGVFALQIWSEYRRDSQARQDAAEKALQEENWKREHPEEVLAAERNADMMIERVLRSSRNYAACATREDVYTCQLAVKRDEALECLTGPHWQSCAAINR